jgi:hypothetical protein
MMMNYDQLNQELARSIIAKHPGQCPPLLVLDEIWANVEVAHTLQTQSGSSKIIEKALCSYNEYEQERNRYQHKSLHRSVSKEFIEKWLMYYQQKFPEQYVYMSSFQVTEEPQAVTHGFIGLARKAKGDIVHVTIPEPLERREYQRIVGNIGLQLIQQLVNKEPIVTDYIDQWYRINAGNLQQDIQTTIEHMWPGSMVCINAEGNLCRMEDIARTRDGYQPLIVMKWSFNPPHIGHLHMMEEAQRKYPGHIPLFSISVDTYDKGKVDAQQLTKRIAWLNALGYPVVLFGSGYFKDNIDVLRYKNTQEIVFPIGLDTSKRIIETYANREEEMQQDFAGIIFEEFSRNGVEDISSRFPTLFSKNTMPHLDVSSSAIRDTTLDPKLFIPEKIRELVVATL